MRAALETTRLAKRYGRRWALRDCSLAVPRGRVAALVGPNGAGKTTLLRMVVGLSRPTRGRILVLGREPDDDLPFLDRIGFVAQDTPTYRDLTVADHLELGRRLNRTWDGAGAVARLDKLAIPHQQRTGTLSGGQRAQVALTIALAKRPDVLVLDEPVASLDPLARRAFLAELMSEVADREVTVILSSHLIADLEHRCDFLIVLAASRVQVLGDIDQLLATHTILSGPTDTPDPEGVVVVSEELADRQRTMLVRIGGSVSDRGWDVRSVSLEELVLAYLGNPASGSLPGPERIA